MLQNRAISSRTTELIQVLAAATYLPTLDRVIAKLSLGSSADAITIHVNNPDFDDEHNDSDRKACNRRRYELAVLRCVRNMFKKWGAKGIEDDETLASYKELRRRLSGIGSNYRGYIISFLRANPATHKFLWWHGDEEFKEAFPYAEKPVEVPDDVKRIMKAFNGELYYPIYNINVFMDRQRLFVVDNWIDGETISTRADKFRQWQKTQPIVL